MSDTRLNPTEEKKARNDRKKQVIRSYPPTPKGITAIHDRHFVRQIT
jgi:hypothetical protein